MLIVYDLATKEIISWSGWNGLDRDLRDDERPYLVDGLSEGQGEYFEKNHVVFNAVFDSIRNKADIELIFDDQNVPIGIKGFTPISVVVDKQQIVADGTDTAMITATVDDPNSSETIELYYGDTSVDSQSAVNGVATFEITMTEPGTLTLTVKSTTKYGQRDITIEGVE